MDDEDKTINPLKFIRNKISSYRTRLLLSVGAGAAGSTTKVNSQPKSTNFSQPIEVVAKLPNPTAKVATITLDTIPPEKKIKKTDSYLVLDSGYKINDKLRGVEKDENGTLIVNYTFKPNNRVKNKMPDSISNNGEKDFRELTKNEKELFKDKFEKISEQIAVRFVEVDDPEDAYISYYSADLSGYLDSETGNTGAAGYASYPTRNGHLIIMDSNLYANSELFYSSALWHEIGHMLGLRHPHKTKGYNTVLSKNLDNNNATMMSYKDSRESSVGGIISSDGTKGRTPDGFQPYDWRILFDKYGPAKDFPEERSFTLGGRREVKTFIGGSEETSWTVDSTAGPSFINMKSGVGNVSKAGDGFYWNVLDATSVNTPNDKNNVLLGSGQGQSFKDGDVSSVFYTGSGVDSLWTAGGADVVQVASSEGRDVWMDYDPDEDIIEYDSSTVESYKAESYEGGTLLLFKDKAGDYSTEIFFPNIKPNRLGKIVPIGPEKMVKPYTNNMTSITVGDHKYTNYLGRGRIFSLPDTTAIEEINISYEDGDTKWKFKDEDGKIVASFAARGAHDTSNCRYIYYNEKKNVQDSTYGGKITYWGVPFHNGEIIYNNGDGNSVIDLSNFCYEGGGGIGVGHNCIAILREANSSNDVYMYGGSFLYRDDRNLILTIDSNAGINRLYTEEDVLKFSYTDAVTVVDCGDGKAAIVTMIYSTGELGNVLYINNVDGKLEEITILDEYTDKPLRKKDIEFSNIRKLPPNIQEQIKAGLNQSKEEEISAKTVVHELKDINNPPTKWQDRVKKAPSKRER